MKGLKAPRSVEDLTKNNKSSAVGTNAEAKTSNASTSGNINNEDEEGWETVKPRTRSKYSPVSDTSSASKRPPRVRHSNKTRFQMPSSAISLPTLAFMKEEENNVVSEGCGSKVGLGKGDSSKSKSKDDGETKTDAVKEESDSGDIAAITFTTDASKKPTSENMANKAEPEEEEDEDEDEEERSADSAIAKLEEGIAMSQLEEDALIKAIRETEQGGGVYFQIRGFNSPS